MKSIKQCNNKVWFDHKVDPMHLTGHEILTLKHDDFDVISKHINGSQALLEKRESPYT